MSFKDRHRGDSAAARRAALHVMEESCAKGRANSGLTTLNFQFYAKGVQDNPARGAREPCSNKT